MDLFSRLLLITIIIISAAAAQAREVQVAVASNFTKPMQEIAGLFKAETGYEAKLAFGSSGKFLAQITNGAPFEVFLSADADKPTRLLKAGLAVEGSRFTYAQGALVLWSAKAEYVEGPGVLTMGDFGYLAVADPKLAPYGVAAMQVIESLNLTEKLSGRLVQGTNISQAFQFVESGNATLGFVALSQVMRNGEITTGSAWVVPAERYEPIKQDAVLLQAGTDNEAARALLDFMRSDTALKVLRSFGYSLPSVEERVGYPVDRNVVTNAQ